MNNYQIITTGCAAGYGFVRDYLGNIWYYGSVEDCQRVITELEEGEYHVSD